MVYSRYEVRAIRSLQRDDNSNTSLHDYDISEYEIAAEQFCAMSDSGRYLYVCLIDLETGETLAEWNS
jgi:hypothetical protein